MLNFFLDTKTNKLIKKRLALFYAFDRNLPTGSKTH